MLNVTRIIEFDSAHRVLKHESKCKHLHGHRYVAHITIKGQKLDEIGRVIDFGVLKDICKGWIDDRLDHNIILNSKDPILNALPAVYWGGKEPFIIPDKNPTVEVLAEVILRALDPAIRAYNSQLCVSRIKLFETPNCYTVFRNPLL